MARDHQTYNGPGPKVHLGNPDPGGRGCYLYFHIYGSPVSAFVRFGRVEHLRKFARWLGRQADELAAGKKPKEK
jgi:hypothetical protein